MKDRSEKITHRSFASVINIIACTLSFLALNSFQRIGEVDKEYRLKAAFIYNFIQYIDWPASPSKDFVVGVIGNSPVEDDLHEIAASKNAGDKKIVIRHFNSIDEVNDCNILFITKDMSGILEAATNKAARGMLIITERPGYAKKGAAINFVVVDNKLKFETNLKAINAAGLKASSQLLKLAIIVD